MGAKETIGSILSIFDIWQIDRYFRYIGRYRHGVNTFGVWRVEHLWFRFPTRDDNIECTIYAKFHSVVFIGT